MNKPKTDRPADRPIKSRIRGAAMQAQRRNRQDAERAASRYGTTAQAPRRGRLPRHDPAALKVSFLGGLEDVGEKNMAIIEYGDDALVLDCGNHLGIDLPGVNYQINDMTYLASIRHKLKGYVITHGHLDHMGGLKHTVPRHPAPVFGSRYTIGVIGRAFQDGQSDMGEDAGFEPELVTVDPDRHERQKLGVFGIEFVRVTHSIPDATAVCIDTPAGRIIATGDFRLDPEPLDRRPSDIGRLRELGDQGVLLLMSDSSYADAEGRVPTESSLQQSFHDIISRAPGRIFVAAFSSNMNRAQMVINAAVAAGRHVALDGRGMLGYAEIAVRQGLLKVPKGAVIPITQAGTVPDDKLLVMCTGGQGEPNAALQRMSEHEHRSINLHAGDTVVISSTPIPGNELRYDALSNRLSRLGVHLFRHPTHELDGCGPLHVSGHARRDELREMLRIVRPRYFVPVHGGRLRRAYHADLAVEEGIPRERTFLPDNGDSLHFTADTARADGAIPHGSLLVDSSGSAVDGIVVTDRLMLAEAGIVAAILTIDRRTGRLLASPDIVSRGFIALRDNEDLVKECRAELRRAVTQRFSRVGPDRFKAELRDHLTHFLYDRTRRSPLVIPVVNLVGGKPDPHTAMDGGDAKRQAGKTTDEQRFQRMREKLLKH